MNGYTATQPKIISKTKHQAIAQALARGGYITRIGKLKNSRYEHSLLIVRLAH